MLVETHLDGYVRDKVAIAIDRLKAFEPEEGYYLAFSGGKDSQCIYHLAIEAGVKFDAHYHITTVDPPELFNFIRNNYPDVKREQPKTSMWKLIPTKVMPPTRMVRYCCSELKEKGGEGRFVITGVRWAESKKRKSNRAMTELNAFTKKRIMLNNDNEESRRLVENCQMKSKHVLNPIIDWLDEDVWQYIKSRELRYCCLHDQGYNRLGCIGCPVANHRHMRKELERYPKYKEAYLRAFARMIEINKAMRKKRFINETPEQVMEWWISGKLVNYTDSFLED
jgi:phosphoadenosine phosphosulfate reductase